MESSASTQVYAARGGSDATRAESVYQKTQAGTELLVVVTIVLAIELLVGVGRGPATALFVISLILACIGVLFSTMTIRVSRVDGVEWWFTFGFLRQRVALTEIQFAVAKRVSLLNGLGVRTNGKDWLWIVSGRDAVQLDMRKGNRVMLGTPEAQMVVLFIDALLSGT